MKKTILIMFTLFLVVSCEDLSDFNVDRKNPSTVPGGALVANATKDIFDFLTSTNVNVNNFRLWSQQWAQTTYADESNYELVERNVNGAAWNTLYAEVLRDLSDARPLIQEDPFLTDEQKANQIAITEVLTVLAYHILVDLFGDVPYTEALTDDVTPKYDDGQTVYMDIISRLDAAINSLGGDTGFANYDIVYSGDAQKWRMFANSLKLRLAIRIAEVDETKAKTMAEQAVMDEAGVFTSFMDQFAIGYQGTTPNTNPLWVDLVQSGRSDYIAANTLVDAMNTLNDPRLPLYYQDMFDGKFVGGVYGDQQPYNAFSHPGARQLNPTWPGIVLSYWEVQFLLADAAQRGFAVGGSAEEFYNEGVRSSILYWGGTEAQADAYLNNSDVAFATAQGTPFQKIALQKWISLYDQGFEAWTTHRFYDYPPMAIAALSELPTPKRYTYPVTEYSLNEENVAVAGSAIGGDLLSTRVFWDVN
jgi:hypothetical protein